MPHYYLILVLVIIVIFFISRIVTSRVGRTFVAIREDELAAESVSIAIFPAKVLSFVIATFFAGIAGAFFAHHARFVSADSFRLEETFIILTMLIVGGMGSISGPVIGAVFLVILSVSGFQPIDDGTMYFNGAALTKLSPHKVAALGIARTFQASRIFKRMTVLEHILVGADKHLKAGLWGAIARPRWVIREEQQARERGLKILEL